MRPGDAIELHAGALQQRLANFRFDVGVPRAREQVARRVVRVVVDVVPNGELRTGAGRLGDRGLEHAGVLEQDPRAAAEEFVVQRAVVLLPEDAAMELGVELAQRRFDAESRIGLGDRRVVGGSRRGRRTHHGAAQLAEHLRVLERDLDHFGEREIPVFGILRVQQRQRRRRGERRDRCC